MTLSPHRDSSLSLRVLPSCGEQRVNVFIDHLQGLYWGQPYPVELCLQGPTLMSLGNLSFCQQTKLRDSI